MNRRSVLESTGVEALEQAVIDVYLGYDYPWVVGYSGGKDSTATLQLIWNALTKIPVGQRRNKVYVISTDTLVETPMIVDHVFTNIDQMNAAAREQGLPLSAHKLRPELDDTFWVNLIGRGYPAPNSMFRWCTDRMKIKPSNRFIYEQVAKHGEVILALGMRKGESATRDAVMKSHRVKGHSLSRHSQIPGAWVFTPIEDFTVADVWEYILGTPKAPWGGDNRSLSSIYASAQQGECPLVVDDSTPSCGNSRFGCWTCTVVARDKSMEAMIDSGEEWMEPLLDFRDWLSETQNPEFKHEQREIKGRDGRVKMTKDGQLRYRTYKLDFSKEMLLRLLEAERRVQAYRPQESLISMAELQEIRKMWITERNDWEDSLPALYEHATKKPFPKSFSDVPIPGKLELDVLTEICAKHEIPLGLPQKLIDAEWQRFGMFKRTEIHNSIDRIFSEDWRSQDEIFADAEARRTNAILEPHAD